MDWKMWKDEVMT